MLVGSGSGGCKGRDAGRAPKLERPDASGVVQASALEGTVLEMMDVGSYSYLRLKTAGGETWAAIPRTVLAVGARVVIPNPMRMDGYKSETLGRKFDHIVFGVLAEPGATGGVGPSGPGAAPAGAAKARLFPAGPLEVAKAPGPDGVRVADIVGRPAAFEGKKVSVRGKVVKFTAGVLDRNWLHLQDGSGAAGADDITVTSKDGAGVGEVVTATGTVHLKRDFGAGYSYPVIVEDATISR